MTIAESTAQPAAQAPPVHTRAVIIGTGFAGLGMAIALQRQGVDFVIVEKADEIGGTWRDNSYPGCACDVPSHLYSFSFEPKATWSKLFSPQPEILDYLKGVTEKYGLRRYIRFGSKVNRAHWDDAEYRWHVFTDSGEEYVTQFLISGAGALHIPRLPEIEGMDEFRGATFHSAQWEHSVDLTGKRVAVIGTGASAIQIVPELVRDAGRGRGAAVSAHAAVGGAAAEQPAAGPGAQSLRVCTRSAAGGAVGNLLGTRGFGVRDDTAARPVARRRVGQ